MDKAALLAQVRRYFPNATEIGEPLDEETIARFECHALPEWREPRARTAGARAGAAPSLDIWTHKRPTGPYTEVHVDQFADGYAEATAIKRPEGFRPVRKGRKRKGKKVRRTEMNPEDLIRCATRAKKMVRWSCKMMGADRILTLTSRRYMITVEDGWKALREFNRLMSAHFGERWSYVAVPELHPENKDHFHFHLAIFGRYPVDIVRDLWRRALWKAFPHAPIEESPGNIDINYRRRTNINKLARYISKYLTKDTEAGFIHAKRYEKSRNIPKPVRTSLYFDAMASDYDIIRKVQEVSGGALTFNPDWVHRAGYEVLWIETEPPG